MESTRIRTRSIHALFNQRFLLGVYAPIVLEFIVYAIYITVRGIPQNWAIFMWPLMLIAPALFFYIISPILIYFISGVGSFYHTKLQENIDSLFIFSDDIANMPSQQKAQIREAIDSQLIPSLVKRVRELYIDSYVSRPRKSGKHNLLSSFETLFLFSLFWSIFALADFVVIIILYFKPISFDFIYLDQITNPVNVTVFSILFAVLWALSSILAIYSIRRSRKLMLEILPIVTPADEDEQINRNNYIRAISHFPIDTILSDRTVRRNMRQIDPIFSEIYTEPLSEAIRVYANNQVAKQQAWRIYKPILDNLEVSPIQTAVIKDKFFDSPFYDIARDVFGYEHEVDSLKTDMEYVKNRLKHWDEISEEEHATALVFLFRSTEQLFKSLIEQFNAPVEIYTNFNMILQFLEEKNLISKKEEKAIDKIRKKRNILVHQSGRVVKIEKKEIENFLASLENVLLNAEKELKPN